MAARDYKKRLPERELKRLRTLRRNKSAEAISEDARRAGRLTPTKFDSERAATANKIRWDKYRAEQAELKKLNKEK